MSISDARSRAAQAVQKQPKQNWPLEASDWHVVRLPPVLPAEGWRMYFGLELPEAA